jgi:transposase InsO family protein
VLQQGVTLKLAAASFSVTERTGQVGQALSGAGCGRAGDRSSRPHRLYRPTASEQIERVEQLRRQRRTGYWIARETGLSRSTVSRILRRLKLNRIRDLEPQPPVIQRYEHKAPGDLLHLDIKKLGRIVRPSHRVTGNRRDHVQGAGWEYVHIAIDDHSRIATRPSTLIEKRSSVVAALHATMAWYARLGIRFKAVLTDNGPSYRSIQFAQACRELGLKHRFTRPYTPRTNGKAERFIQTALSEWAYACSYEQLPAHPTATLMAAPLQLAPPPRQPQPSTSHQPLRIR